MRSFECKAVSCDSDDIQGEDASAFRDYPAKRLRLVIVDAGVPTPFYATQDFDYLFDRGEWLQEPDSAAQESVGAF